MLSGYTYQLMEEAFAGRICSVCQRPAARLYRHAFYCVDHCPLRVRERQQRVKVKEVRVPVFVKGLPG